MILLSTVFLGFFSPIWMRRALYAFNMYLTGPTKGTSLTRISSSVALGLWSACVIEKVVWRFYYKKNYFKTHTKIDCLKSGETTTTITLITLAPFSIFFSSQMTKAVFEKAQEQILFPMQPLKMLNKHKFLLILRNSQYFLRPCDKWNATLCKKFWYWGKCSFFSRQNHSTLLYSTSTTTATIPRPQGRRPLPPPKLSSHKQPSCPTTTPHHALPQPTYTHDHYHDDDDDHHHQQHNEDHKVQWQVTDQHPRPMLLFIFYHYRYKYNRIERTAFFVLNKWRSTLSVTRFLSSGFFQ